MIRRYPRSIGSAARLRGKHLVEEAALLHIAGEDFPLVDVLIANRRREIFPARVFRVLRWITRIWRDVTRTARYADAIRTDEPVIIVISWIVHETIAVPFLARFIVEFGIWKKAKTKNAGGFAVNGLVDAFRFRLDLLVQPQPKFIRLASGTKPGLVYQAQGFKTFAARKLAIIKNLQKIHQPETVLCGLIPKVLVTTAPQVPGVAAHDFLGRKIEAAIHRLENISSNLREIGCCQAGSCGLVHRLVFFTCAHCRAKNDRPTCSNNDAKIFHQALLSSAMTSLAFSEII